MTDHQKLVFVFVLVGASSWWTYLVWDLYRKGPNTQDFLEEAINAADKDSETYPDSYKYVEDEDLKDFEPTPDTVVQNDPESVKIAVWTTNKPKWKIAYYEHTPDKKRYAASDTSSYKTRYRHTGIDTTVQLFTVMDKPYGGKVATLKTNDLQIKLTVGNKVLELPWHEAVDLYFLLNKFCTLNGEEHFERSKRPTNGTSS